MDMEQKTDRIVVTVLRDGTIKSITGEISGVNHSNAEGFFEILKQKLGGEEVREAQGHEGQEQSPSHTHEQQHG